MRSTEYLNKTMNPEISSATRDGFDGGHRSVKDENTGFVNERMPRLSLVKEEVCDDDDQPSLNIDEDINNTDQKTHNSFDVSGEKNTDVKTDDNDVFYKLDMFLLSVKKESEDIETDVGIDDNKVRLEGAVTNLSPDKYKLEIECNDQVIKIEKEELDGYTFDSEIVIEKIGFNQIVNREICINDSEPVISTQPYCTTDIDQNRNKCKKNIYTCASCHQQFNSKKILILHMKHHSHELNKCSSDVVFKKYIKVKPKQIHPGTKIKFTCTYCSKSFSDQSNCHRHTKYHCPRLISPLTSDLNNSVKIFKCLTCQLTFKRKHSLQVHQKKHTGENPFKCDDCHLTFHRKDYMEVHRKIHKNKYPVDPYYCKTCHKQLHSKSSLVRHEKSHVISYYCNYCLQPFPRKDTLIYHFRSKHTGEKPFKCDICQKYFFNKTILTHHNNSKSHKLNVETKKLKNK